MKKLNVLILSLIIVLAACDNDSSDAPIPVSNTPIINGCPDCETGIVEDADNNLYVTVKIDDQWWMAENLATTKLNDGTPIDMIFHESEWSTATTSLYSWYEDKSINKDQYGALYNGYTIQTDKVCPTGWHVATDDDWKKLELKLGVPQEDLNKTGLDRGSSEIIEQLKAASDVFNNQQPGNNDSGFGAMPAGVRKGYSGQFEEIGEGAFFWAMSDVEVDELFYRYIGSTPGIGRFEGSLTDGFAVRCVKD